MHSKTLLRYCNVAIAIWIFLAIVFLGIDGNSIRQTPIGCAIFSWNILMIMVCFAHIMRTEIFWRHDEIYNLHQYINGCYCGSFVVWMMPIETLLSLIIFMYKCTKETCYDYAQPLYIFVIMFSHIVFMVMLVLMCAVISQIYRIKIYPSTNINNDNIQTTSQSTQVTLPIVQPSCNILKDPEIV